MDDSSYQLGKLQGTLNAFAWINQKPDNNFNFEITTLSSDDSLEKQVELYFKQWYNEATVKYKTLQEPSILIDNLETWLFSNIDDLNRNKASYQDILGNNNFSLSILDPKLRQEFAQGFYDDLDNLLEIEYVLEVRIDTSEWYEAGWNDYAIEGKHGRVFLHLGVTD